MAEILPIRPWRYHSDLLKNIEELAAPLFDVVTPKQRDALYHHPLNSIHLSVPQGPDPITTAAKTLEGWKEAEVLVQDVLPGIYVYYQYFKVTGDPKIYCRKGFVCHVRTYDWSENVILRHENTIPKAVNDRVELLDKLELHTSPTHGLYTDPDFQLEKYMDEAMNSPILEMEDYQGTRDVLAVIHDAAAIEQFVACLKDKTIILADGHHRYEGSLIHKRRMEKKFPGQPTRGFHYHLMYLSNTESDDLKIMPTHRIIKNLAGFDEALIVRKLSEDFTVKRVNDCDTLNEIIAGKPWTFGIMMKENCFKVSLKPEAFEKLMWPFPEAIKRLDLTVMHYFIIEKILGIPGRLQRRSEQLDFNRSYSECLKEVIEGQARMAIITNEISIDEVKTVCHSGYTMPQKSTYFYPKVMGGFLFTSIREDEFAEPVYSPFFEPG